MSRKKRARRTSRAVEPAPEAMADARRRRRVARWAALALILAVQVAATVSALTPAPHNGGDNAGYLALAHSLVTTGSYTESWDPETPPHTKYPPVYPALLGAAMVLGAEGWGAFKAISVVFVVASALLTFLWAEGRRGAVFAAPVALLLALSPAVLWSSRWVLSDPLFLALTLFTLWAFQRAAEPGAGRGWVWAGAAAAVLATFTRTAGLPLVLAVAGWLALERRWRTLAAFLGAFALPSGLWWLRGQAGGGAQYVSEFWMVNPYQPDLGTVGVAGLFARMIENLKGYLLEHVPAGLAPYQGGALVALGVVLTLAALAGWALRIRRERTVAELFMPLYFGLILLWPAVWSGDRFALPLYPLVLFYAGEALVDGAKRVHRLAPWGVAVVVVIALAGPQLRSWSALVREASTCTRAVRASGPFACYSDGFQAFTLAARWLGENAPDGAAVFSRKPRIFYTLSGVPSRTYPLTPDPERFLDEAERGGIRYVVLDRVDGLGVRYVGSVVSARPEAFCTLAGLQGADGGRTEILGILGREAEASERRGAEEGTVIVDVCPPGMLRSTPRELPPYTTSRLPLLALPRP